MRGKLATREVLVARLSRNGLIGLVIIVIAMSVGMSGYMYFGSMKFDDAFANAAMILSGMGPLDKLDTPSGLYFEGLYAIASGITFFAVTGIMISPLLHRILHSFHLEDENG
jgi:hypothetical protein